MTYSILYCTLLSLPSVFISPSNTSPHHPILLLSDGCHCDPEPHPLTTPALTAPSHHPLSLPPSSPLSPSSRWLPRRSYHFPLSPPLLSLPPLPKSSYCFQVAVPAILMSWNGKTSCIQAAKNEINSAPPVPLARVEQQQQGLP